MPAGLSLVRGDIALTLTAAGAGATSSGAIEQSGAAGMVVALVHCTAATGTGPTLNVAIEQSANGSTGWAAITGGAAAQLSAAGSAIAFAVPSQAFVRVTATVGGTTPAVTASVAVLVAND